MKRFFFSLVLVLLTSTALVFSQVPRLLNYQANLKDQNERPFNGQIAVTFAIYEQEFGGTPVWSENQLVDVVNGFMNVYLGKENPININFNKPLWLQISIGGNAFPRTPLTSTPYAMKSLTSTTSDTATIALTVVDGAITQEKLAPGVQAYPWGPAGGDLTGTYPNPTLNPQAVVRNIPPGSITQDKLAPNVSFPPSGPASGDLTGTYPDPLIAPGAVKTDRIFNGAVTTPKLADGAVTTPKIADGAVTNSKIGPNAVTTDKIKDGEVYLVDLNQEVIDYFINIGDPAGGDLYGTYPNPFVGGWRGIPLSTAAPSNGQTYIYDLANNRWVPSNLNGDVVGPINNNTVTKWLNVPLFSTPSSDGQVYVYSQITNDWRPSFAGGDVTGPYNDLTVGALLNVPLAMPPSNVGDIYWFNGSQWVPGQIKTKGPIVGFGYDNGVTVAPLKIRDDAAFLPDGSGSVLWFNGAPGTGQWVANLVRDINVASNAAIQGTKIVPNFGSQNIITSGNLNVNDITSRDINARHGTFSGNLSVNGTTTLTGQLTGSTATFSGNVQGQNIIATNLFQGKLQYSVTAGNGLSGGSFDNTANRTFNVNVDNSTIGINAGTNALYLLDNAVTTPKIANNAVTTAKIAPSGTNNQFLVTNNLGSTTWLTFNKSSKFTGDGVGTPLDIAAGAITTTEIADGTITNADMGPNSVGTTNIQNNAVTTAKIAPSGTNNQFLVTNTLGNTTWLTFNKSSKFTGDGVGTALDIAAGAITTTEIADGTITNADMGPNSVGTANIQNGAVTNAKLAADAVTTDKIFDGTITNADMGPNSVGTANIQNNAVTNAKIAPSGTNNQFLVTNNLGSTTWLTFNKSSKFTGDGVGTPLDIAAGAITTTEIADGTITNADMGPNSVGTSNIINASVTPAKIQPSATNDYVLKTVGGNVTWAPDDFTLPVNKVSNDANNLFTITRSSGTNSVIVAVNNGTLGNAGRFINGGGNNDNALYARTDGTGYSFYAEKNTSAIGEYVAAIRNVNAGAGRSLLVTSNTPTAFPYNSPGDFGDADEATLVVWNTALAPRIAIKTYGDIVTNSSVISDEIVGVSHVYVGNPASGLYYDLQPPTTLGGPLDIYGTPGYDANVRIWGTPFNVPPAGVYELEVIGDAQVTGTMSIGSATFGSITVTGQSDLQGNIVNTSGNNGGRVYVNDDFQVTGNSWFDGNMTVGDSPFDLMTINSTLSVINSDVLVGSGTFNNNDAGPDLYVADRMEVDGSVWLGDGVGGDALTVNATSTFNSQVTVSPNNDLIVGNIAGFGNTSVSSDAYVQGNLEVDGSVWLGDGVGGDVLTVNAAVSIISSNDLKVGNTGTFNNTSVSSDAYVEGNLEVDGHVYLGDAVTDNIVFTGRVNSHVLPATDNAYDLGSAANSWKDIYYDGTLWGNNISVIGNTTLGDAAADALTVNATATFVNNAFFNGDVTLGNAAGDNIVFTGRVNSDVLPASDNTRDLGSAALRWNDIFFGGTLSGASATFTDLSVTGNTTLGDGVGADVLTVNATSTFVNNAFFNGDVTLGNASGDNIVFTGSVNSNIIPTPSGTRNLGSSTNKWNALWIQSIQNDGLPAGSGVTVNDELVPGGASGTYDLGSTGNRWKTVYSQNADFNGSVTLGDAAADALTVNATATFVNNAFFNGDVTLGNAAGDNIVFTGRVNSNVLPATDNAYDLGSAANSWKDIYYDGTLWGNNISVTGSTTLGDAAADALTVNATATFVNNAFFNGDVTLGNAAGDNIVFTGRVNSNVFPATDNTYDLGSAALRWNDIFFGGTLSGASATFTNLSVTGNTTLGDGVGADVLTVNATSTFVNDAFFNGNVTLGDNATDNIVFTGSVNSNIIPTPTNTRNLGSSTNNWNILYVQTIQNDGPGGATTVNVNDDLLPSSSLTYNLGSSGSQWATIYAQTANLSSTLNVTTANVSGNLTVNGNSELKGTVYDAGDNKIDFNSAISVANGQGFTKLSYGQVSVVNGVGTDIATINIDAYSVVLISGNSDGDPEQVNFSGTPYNGQLLYVYYTGADVLDIAGQSFTPAPGTNRIGVTLIYAVGGWQIVGSYIYP